MAYDGNKPADNEYVSAGPGVIRENFRALKEDQIVNAGQLASKSAGNANGNIPVSNGTVCANLNADKLDGNDAAAFAAAAHGHAVATGASDGFMSAADKTKLDGVAAGAEVNQYAWSNILVGGVTVASASKTGTFELIAGANVTLTPDNTGKTVTFAVNCLPSAGGTLTGDLTINKSTWTQVFLNQWNASTASMASILNFNRSKNATPGSHTVVANGDALGYIRFAGSDGTDFEIGAEIRAYVDGTPGNNDMPGRLEFLTTPDGSTSLTTRMIINNQGNVTFGATDLAGSTSKSFIDAGAMRGIHVRGQSNDQIVATDSPGNETLGAVMGYDDSGTTTAFFWNKYANSDSSKIVWGFGTTVGTGTVMTLNKLGCLTVGNAADLAGSTYRAFFDGLTRVSASAYCLDVKRTASQVGNGVGFIRMFGNNASNADALYAMMFGYIVDNTDGTHDGGFGLNTVNNGTDVRALTVNNLQNTTLGGNGVDLAGSTYRAYIDGAAYVDGALTVNGAGSFTSLTVAGATPRTATSKANQSATATGYWRIASSPQGIGINHGLIRVAYTDGTNFGSILFSVNQSFGGANNSIKVLGRSDSADFISNSLGPLDARIVYHTTASGNYAHFEVYLVKGATNIVLNYELLDGSGWSLIDIASGSVPAGYTASYLDLTTRNANIVHGKRAYEDAAGADTFTVPPGVHKIYARLWGGGGGGGAGKGNGAGGGGASGGYYAVEISVTPGAVYNVSIGAGGNGGVEIGGNPQNGSNGNDTTITVGATTYTASGGTGGAAGNGSKGAGGAAVAGGTPGQSAMQIDISGSGGGSAYGIGAWGIMTTQTAGTNASVLAAGGSGGVGSATTRNGGAGLRGAIVIEW